MQVFYNANRVTTAHELGHALTLGHPCHEDWGLLCSEHSEFDNWLMYPSATTQTFIPASACDVARNEARKFHDRYNNYNFLLGRVPATNPVLPPAPNMFDRDPSPMTIQEMCCQTTSGLAYTPAPVCLYAGGTVLPDSDCSVCCLVDEVEPHVEFVPHYECAGTQLPTNDCTVACCELDLTQVELPVYECVAAGGELCAGNIQGG